MDNESLQALVDSLRRQLRGVEFSLNVKRGTVREQSLNEREAMYHARGHGSVFCVHDRSYFIPCRNCKRTQHDADAKREAFFSKLGI